MSIDAFADVAVRTAFRQLSGLVYAGADTASVQQALVDACVELVDGCERASLMLRRGKRFETAAASDEVARAVDQIEIAVGEGPCLDAIVDEAYQHCPDLAVGSPWPQFSARVLAETPVRSAIGYRLLLDGEKEGALNLFADQPGALSIRAADQGAVLASFASVTLMTMRARDEAATLRAGLESNREIGKAVGLLMAAHKMEADEAFAILKKTSQDLNMKLVAVAARVIEGQQSQYASKPAPH